VNSQPLRFELRPDATAVAASNGIFLLPAMAGLSPETVDLLGCLPIANVNAELVDYFATPKWQPQSVEFACVFAADPFYDPAQLIDDLQTAHVSGIANLPSLGILEGRFAEVMSASGFDFQRELQCLEFAKRQGLRTSAFVCNEDQGKAGLQSHADQIIVHPGGFFRQTPDREAAVSKTVKLINQLQQCAAGRTPVLLYRHPSLYYELADAAQAADGTIVYLGS
jgi:predicted TIM-barrel enzyme